MAAQSRIVRDQASSAVPYGVFTSASGFRLFALRAMRLIQPCLNTRRRAAMLDTIFIVLGFGGILLMAAYAVLCGRI
jgi:hypothetical protein